MTPAEPTSAQQATGGRIWPPGPGLTAALERLSDQGQVLISGLEGSARAFALARAFLAGPVTTLAVCPTLAGAEALARDLEFFLAGSADGISPVRLYPAYEVSPYDELDPPPEVTARRMAVLWELMAGEAPLIVVTSARGLTPRLCPPEHLLDSALMLAPGMTMEREALVQALMAGGYAAVGLVEQVGDFAVRGSVVDFFGPLLDEPVRVELFGDEIESIRSFDPTDQRSQLGLKQANLVPCHPVDLSPAAVERAVKSLRELAEAEGLSTRQMAGLIERMELRAPFTGLESLLPLYFPAAADLFAYLPERRRHVLVEPAEVDERLAAEAEQLAVEFAEAREEGRPVLPPPMLRRTPEQIGQRLAAAPRMMFKALGIPDGSAGRPVMLRAAGHTGLRQSLAAGGQGSVLARLAMWVAGQGDQGRDVALVCRSRSQVSRLAELLAEHELPAKTAPRALDAGGRGDGALFLLVGGLAAGFTPDDLPLTFVTEDEVFGAAKVVRHRAAPRLSAALAALDDLEPGDLVVHVDHGVGRYQGLISMAVGPAESDFLHLAYAGGDKLYLPADRMGLISKYRGPEEGRPQLDKLGGTGWARTKRKVQKAVEAIARDLVELYAARSFLKGHAYAPPDSSFREFEAGFPFEETPDQARAIEDVIGDLCSPRPMDRLVCGDVGFGKTEVALRAAFLIALQGRQVAVLVPTTVLAEQHYQTFAQRLTDQPLEVRSLSRFKTPAQQKKILLELAEGRVDIVIGTHRLLQKDVVFKDLGLVVVDEEHRFGVGDKERLKKMRRLVDVLALTATPIPRTLQMSLSGIRDLSVIGTPPQDRQAIKTYLAGFSARAVREAVERELGRGGQVFFVHNRVADIGRLARMVQRLVPAARVGVAHGQMGEKSLEKVMLQFVQRELDVLVCTTIIESGLDIASANTIIIDEADKLGLSQIYQLRGRVGRGGERAYAYLFIKSETSISRDARKRLKALMDFTHLGAGFSIATHDLQIRGAGNLLGEVQSGQVAEVGYELYLRMLEEAVARMKGEAPPEGPEPELNLSMPAFLPESYLPDPQVRLSMYKRLSQARSAEEVAGVAEELADRFGPPPEPVDNLLAAVGLKELMRSLLATRLDLSRDSMRVHFAHGPRVDLNRLLALAETDPRRVKVHPEGRVSLRLSGEAEPFVRAREFLEHIRS